MTAPNRSLESPKWQLDLINESLAGASPRTIALWALAQRLPTMLSTSFGEQSAALLHLMTGLAPELPVVWVDTGLATEDTRTFQQDLTQRLELNLQVYRPSTPAFALLHQQGASQLDELDEVARQQLVDAIKIEPFQNALDVIAPAIWISGIRADETEHRAALAPVTRDASGILKVAPFFESSAAEVDAYLKEYGLPVNAGYVDPTKAAPHLECGLHR